MKKINIGIVILVVYFAGFISGISLQNVKAVVKVPGENNQPIISGSNTARQKQGTQNGIKRIVKPASEPKPSRLESAKKETNTPEKTPAGIPEHSSVPTPEPTPIPTPVKQTLNQSSEKSPAVQPTSPPAATAQGATLYSVSSSMLADIARMEKDLAAIKNKANIISNMRQ